MMKKLSFLKHFFRSIIITKY